MRIVSVDFNAMTESEEVRLNLPCSQADLDRLNLNPGDWAWLSDGEVIVGARLVEDTRFGLVGIPDWDTVLHLDEPGGEDFIRVDREMKQLMAKAPRSHADEARLLELTAQWEHVAPSDLLATSPGKLALCRAESLWLMRKPELALLEAREARVSMPEDSNAARLYQNLLKQIMISSAVREELRRIGG